MSCLLIFFIATYDDGPGLFPNTPHPPKIRREPVRGTTVLHTVCKINHVYSIFITVSSHAVVTQSITKLPDQSVTLIVVGVAVTVFVIATVLIALLIIYR